MKKSGILVLFLLFVIVLSTVAILAQDNLTVNDDNGDMPQDDIEMAYSCLEQKVEDKCEDLTSVEEIAFSLLALAYDTGIQTECRSALMDMSDDDECWPDGGCRLRDTSLAVLALDNINKNVDDPKDWLLDKKIETKDLTWFLEIDASEPVTCKISYNARDYNVILGTEKKLNGGAGDCLSVAQSGYWLQISSNCLDTNFTVSCNKEFISTLLYKKTTSDTFYVSSNTKTAAQDGTTEHTVESFCFEKSGECDYEGSLWATLAFSKIGEDPSGFLPYLLAYADDNKEFNPDAFLHILTGYNEYEISLGNLQNTEGFWNLDSPYSKFYDTALSVLAIENSDYADIARTSLLDTQGTDGCWQNSVRDTSFILYSAWPKDPIFISGGGSNGPEYCADYNYYCITEGECTEAEGQVLNNYRCSGVSYICCNQPAVQRTCTEQQGTICGSGEQCSGSYVSASDSSFCCLAGCEPVQVNECEDSSYLCKSLCSDNEEIKSYDCPDAADFCCGLKPASEKSYWWIWVLVILIILVVIGIIFRDKLRLFIHNLKNRGKGSSPGQRRPPFPPSAGPRPLMPQSPRRMMPNRGPPPKRSPSPKQTDNELEETLKKLKEIGK
ncbi:MAG: hypothetical protein ABIE22_01105 [archaeon]